MDSRVLFGLGLLRKGRLETRGREGGPKKIRKRKGSNWRKALGLTQLKRDSSARTDLGGRSGDRKWELSGQQVKGTLQEVRVGVHRKVGVLRKSSRIIKSRRNGRISINIQYRRGKRQNLSKTFLEG